MCIIASSFRNETFNPDVYRKEIVRDGIKGIKSEDGNELSIFDTIEDSKSKENYDDLMYDLVSLCRHCERYGINMDQTFI